MKKIVITGGLGYIGTELCKIYSGYSWNDEIIVIDNRFISERVTQLRIWNINFIRNSYIKFRKKSGLNFKKIYIERYNLDLSDNESLEKFKRYRAIVNNNEVKKFLFQKGLK